MSFSLVLRSIVKNRKLFQAKKDERGTWNQLSFLTELFLWGDFTESVWLGDQILTAADLDEFARLNPTGNLDLKIVTGFWENLQHRGIK